MIEKTLRMTMLFDFFGSLLTEKQRGFFDLYYNEDLSLSEIAEKADISRQGVYDIITRAAKSLEEFENKTGAVERWHETRTKLEKAGPLISQLLDSQKTDVKCTSLINELNRIIKGIYELNGV